MNFIKTSLYFVFIFLVSAFLAACCFVKAAGAVTPHDSSKREVSINIKNQNEILKGLQTNEVKIGTYILNIRKIDVASGTWIVDYYLWLVWPAGGDISPTNFEVMNGSIDYKAEPILETIEIEGRKYIWLEQRIISTISSDLNFRHYPLDVQTLTIEIEDRDLSISKMRYVVAPEESNIDDHVKIQGWEINDKFNKLITHKYKTTFGYDSGGATSEVYSRYIFGISISRPRFSSLLKLILPLSIILSLSFLSFALSPDKVSQRISLGVSTVFTSVAFHINLTSAIPQVSYLTLADRLMISSYFILFCSLISTILLIRYVDSEQMEKASRLNRFLGTIVPAGGIALIIAQFYIN